MKQDAWCVYDLMKWWLYDSLEEDGVDERRSTFGDLWMSLVITKGAHMLDEAGFVIGS